MDDRLDDAELALKRLHDTVGDLERRARALATSILRHDVANAVGAARNALVLLGESPEPEVAARFMEIATRNVDLASRLLGGGTASSGDQRNDLGGTSERDHRDALGL